MKFWKMTGGGNDFVLIRNVKGLNLHKTALRLCERKFGVGADGLLAVDTFADRIVVKYLNPDGTEAFCGNGSRCAALWAMEKGFCGKKVILETKAGLLSALKRKKDRILLEMPAPKKVSLFIKGSFSNAFPNAHFIDTGCAHIVIIVEDERKIDVFSTGKAIRYNKIFSPEGTNVNFVAFRDGKFFVRTYERGVENETLACGTGLAACAVALYLLGKAGREISLISASKIKFCVKIDGKDKIERLWADGPAQIVFQGEFYDKT